jgi:hypothetical protein
VWDDNCILQYRRQKSYLRGKGRVMYTFSNKIFTDTSTILNKLLSMSFQEIKTIKCTKRDPIKLYLSKLWTRNLLNNRNNLILHFLLYQEI